MLYPMHVMNVTDFLDRYAGGDRKLESHQKLKRLGLVAEISKELLTDAEVLFMSHEWTGFTHPDPNGHQTRELCLLLQRLRSGAVAKVESSWEYQLSFKRKDVVEAAEWVQRLEKAYIWLDYICVPQPNATDDDDVAGDAESTPSLERQATSDARLGAPLNSHLNIPDENQTTSMRRADLAQQCSNAVSSIPAYIEMSTIFMVFAPNTPHANRTEEQGATVCSVASWRGRGWCRTEFIGGLLAPRPKYAEMNIAPR
jgi:hypothetical protein